MKLSRALVNIAAIVGLFCVFALPVGRMVFSGAGQNVITRFILWLGVYRDAEPGDYLVDSSLFISLCKHIPNAVLTMRKSGGIPFDSLRITMSDVIVTSVELSASY
jgi:hypothetical protein